MRAGASAWGLCLLEFADRPELPQELAFLAEHFGAAPQEGPSPLLDLVREELAAYFAGQLTAFSVPLDTPGTNFQRRVWQSLAEVPFGKTVSYGVLAKALTGDTRASRAVAAANGQNRVAILVPCHRVVGAGGALTGYAGGLERKAKLLALESGQGALF